MVDPYLPPVSGMLWWIHKQRRRIQAPMEEFILFEDPYVAILPNHNHNQSPFFIIIIIALVCWTERIMDNDYGQE